MLNGPSPWAIALIVNVTAVEVVTNAMSPVNAATSPATVDMELGLDATVLTETAVVIANAAAKGNVLSRTLSLLLLKKRK